MPVRSSSLCLPGASGVQHQPDKDTVHRPCSAAPSHRSVRSTFPADLHKGIQPDSGGPVQRRQRQRHRRSPTSTGIQMPECRRFHEVVDHDFTNVLAARQASTNYRHGPQRSTRTHTTGSLVQATLPAGWQTHFSHTEGFWTVQDRHPSIEQDGKPAVIAVLRVRGKA